MLNSRGEVLLGRRCLPDETLLRGVRVVPEHVHPGLQARLSRQRPVGAAWWGFCQRLRSGEQLTALT